MDKIKLSNSNIAKNTSFLYFRMIFVLGVTLFTSRIVLAELGVIDYGIYNVVASFVVMFSFFGSALSNAAQRFLNFSYALNDEARANQVFCTGFLNFFIMSILVVVILETFGIWFLNNKLVIPIERLKTANVIFHLSVFSVFVTINSYVYRATLIARENMAIYAYTGIFESIARLGVAYMLMHSTKDKLMLYAFLYMIVSVIVSVVYLVYCTKKYKECRYKIYYEFKLFKEMFVFVGWNAITSLIEVINHQGIGVVLNLFFGPIVNAARGVAFQIYNALLSFSHNIYMATRPQLIKAYAVKDMEFFISTIYSSSKFTYYLLLMIAIPLLLNIESILDIWLVDVPEYTAIFSFLIIIYTLIDSLRNPLWAAAQAVGDLRKYSLIGGSIFILNFPLAYMLMYLDFNPEWVYIVYIIIRLIYIVAIIYIVNDMIFEFSVSGYFISVVLPIFIVSFIAPIIPSFLYYILDSSLFSLILVSVVSFICTIIVVYIFGLKISEKKMIRNFILFKLLNKSES